MAQDVGGPPDLVQRKQSRPTRARGKAGYRRLEAILEAANIVVQRVETENDIGRDAFVDIVEGTDVTGGVICVQVKSGRKSYFHGGNWLIPGRTSDFVLWRESTVPFFGIAHDPHTDALRWVDLSEAAAMALDGYLSPIVTGPFGRSCVPVPENNRLDLDLAPFLAAAQTALRRRSGTPVGALLADDVETVESGIADTFAVGRHDPNAFLLLAALFHRLPRAIRSFAVAALATTTSHPDVLWTKNNWIPDKVSSVVRQRVRWTEIDISALLTEIDESGIERGSIGQTVYHVLSLDENLQSKLFKATLDRSLSNSVRFWAAAILLFRSGEEAPEMLESLFRSDEALGSDDGLFPLSHGLGGVEHFEQLVQSIEEFGYISLF